MARRVIRLTGNVTKHWSRRWGVLLSMALAMGAGGVYVQNVLAVHDTGRFELDGNTVSNSTDDWDRVCFQVTASADCGAAQGTTGNNPNLSTGAIAVSWTGDCLIGQAGIGCTDPNSTIFSGGGSKDPQDISAWAWKDGAGGLPDKDNLVHAFAARYSSANSVNCPSGGFATCEVIYFGSDRFDNSGDAQQGFWFLQNPVALGTNKVGGALGFTGLHRNGDLLVISDFSNGGGTSTITVLKWDSSCLATDTSKNPPPQPCADANLRRLATSDSALCGGATGDPFCGIVNTTAINTSWPTDFTDKSGNSSYLAGEFFEAGVNLSTLGLGGECFSTVVSETRSSTSTTATLKDFVLGNFATCLPSLTTSVQGLDATRAVSPGTQVRDLATANITGAATPDDGAGTVKFFLCGNSTANPDCSTGGTLITTTSLVDTAPPNPKDGVSVALSDYVNTSGNPLPTGFYCFRAEVTLTNYPNPPAGFFSHTNTTTECFRVKDSSTTTTAQDWLPNDSATVKLSNGTTNGAGSVTFSLYQNGSCTGPATTFGPIALVNGTARTSNISLYTSTQTVSWRVTFTSTDPNVDGSTSGCEVSTVTITN